MKRRLMLTALMMVPLIGGSTRTGATEKLLLRVTPNVSSAPVP